MSGLIRGNGVLIEKWIQKFEPLLPWVCASVLRPQTSKHTIDIGVQILSLNICTNEIANCQIQFLCVPVQCRINNAFIATDALSKDQMLQCKLANT